MTYCIFFSSRDSGAHLIKRKQELEGIVKDKFYEFISDKKLIQAYTLYRKYKGYDIFREEEILKTRQLNGINTEIMHIQKSLVEADHFLQAGIDEDDAKELEEQKFEFKHMIQKLEDKKIKIEDNFKKNIL